jgi:hypothetical protein
VALGAVAADEPRASAAGAQRPRARSPHAPHGAPTRCSRPPPRAAQELYIDDLDDTAMEALARLELPSLRSFEAKAGVGNWLARVADAPWLPQLESLEFAVSGFVRGALAGAGPCRHLEKLKLLDNCGWGWIEAQTAASLAALELPALSLLMVGRLGSRDVATLSGAAWWTRLACLVVSLDAEDDGGLAAVRALVRRPLPRLCSLTVGSKPLCAEALRLLAAFELPGLTALFCLSVEAVDEEEESRCIDAARAVLEGALWRRQCDDFHIV